MSHCHISLAMAQTRFWPQPIPFGSAMGEATNNEAEGNMDDMQESESLSGPEESESNYSGLVPEHPAYHDLSDSDGIFDDASSSGCTDTSYATGTTDRDRFQQWRCLNAKALQRSHERDCREPSEHRCGVYSVRLSDSSSHVSDSETLDHGSATPDHGAASRIHESVCPDSAAPDHGAALSEASMINASAAPAAPDHEAASRTHESAAPAFGAPDHGAASSEVSMINDSTSLDHGSAFRIHDSAAPDSADPDHGAASSEVSMINDSTAPDHGAASRIQDMNHDPPGPHLVPAPSSPSSPSSSATWVFGCDNKKRRLQ